MMLYITLSTVKSMERKPNRYLRRWLGIASPQQDCTAKLRLPLSSVVEEFKTGKAHLIMTLKDSRDEKCEAGVEYKQEVNGEIVGSLCKERQGLGTEPKR
jgi:hypothetical protein